MPSEISRKAIEALPLRKLLVGVEDETILARFDERVDKAVQLLSAQVAHQHTQQPRYGINAAWAWFTTHRKELLARHARICLTKGLAAGDAFVRAEWEKVYPRRPGHRPAGQVTKPLLRRLAMARVLAELLQKAEHFDTKVKPAIERKVRRVNGERKSTNVNA